MALTDITCSTDVSMNTDLYELTMAQGLWENGKLGEQGCFLPRSSRAVWERARRHGGTAELGSSSRTGSRMRTSRIWPSLRLRVAVPVQTRLSSSCAGFCPQVDIDAIPEGELVSRASPWCAVSGPMLDCQLLETACFYITGSQTPGIDQDRPCGPGGSGQAWSRSSWPPPRPRPDGGGGRTCELCGCASTSNARGSSLWYSCLRYARHSCPEFPTELEAFRACLAKSCPRTALASWTPTDVRGRGQRHHCRPRDGGGR